METISEIKAAVAKFRSSVEYTKLRTRWEDDFEFYRLKPHDAGYKRYSYTTNEPRNLANRTISMITESKLLVRFPEAVLSAEDKKIASNIERLYYGVVNLNNERLNVIPDMPNLIEQLAWYAIVRGGFAIRAYVYKNEDGETEARFDVWDIYNVAYAAGAKGAAWTANSRKVSKEEAIGEYPNLKDKINKAEVDIIDFSDDKKNAVIVDDYWGKEPTKHNLGYNPTAIIKVGAMPPVWQTRDMYANVHQGESIFASIRQSVPIISQLISDYATIVHRGVKVPLVYWSAGGKKTIEEDVYDVDKAAVIQLDSIGNEKLEPLIKPTMPADAAALFNILSGEVQRGGMTHLAMGELGFRLSGYAISQLNAQMTAIIIPYIVAVEKGLKLGLKWITNQYAQGGYKPLGIRGRTSRNEVFGIPRAQMIAPEDIEKGWEPEVVLLPQLPKDDLQKHQLAQLAYTTGYLSLDTIHDDILGIADPELEQEKLDREWADRLEINRLYKAFEIALADGDMVKSENIRMELIQFMQARSGKLPMPNTGGLERRAARPRPETQPYEETAEVPPGAQNARFPQPEMMQEV